MSGPLELAIVILNYRTPQLTIDCLRSLAAERAQAPAFHVWLLDNASGDDSMPRLEAALRDEGWREFVTLMPQARNSGFAGGNNIGVAAALAQDPPPRHVLLLNSDTLVHPGCLRTSLTAMDHDPAIGLLSCMLENRDGSVQNVCWRFPTPLRETVRALALPYVLPRFFSWAETSDRRWDRRAGARDVEWVGGAFMLLRAETLRRLGGFDETFFFYGEDIELCHRMWRHGLHVRFDPAGTITHFGGASSDPTRMADRRRATLMWFARFRVQRKLYGRLAELWLRGIYIAVFGAKVAWLLLTGQRATPRYAGAAAGLSVLIRPLHP